MTYKDDTYTFRVEVGLLEKFRDWSKLTGIPTSRLIRNAMERYYADSGPKETS